jgi:methylthioribose-1-phosphate isomerase
MKDLEDNSESIKKARPTAVIFFISCSDIDDEEQIKQLNTWLGVLGRQRPGRSATFS